MEISQKRKQRRRLTGFFLSLMMIVSLFGDFASTAYAGVTVGASGSIDATGYKTNLGGGLPHEEPLFRVGIMRDPSFYNDTTPTSKADAIKAWGHRYPDNEESLFFVPNGDWAKYTNYEVGAYVPSTRKMSRYADAVSKARVQPLNSSGSTQPPATGKALLSTYSFTGTKQYSSLSGGKWKTIASQITPAQANSFWSYVLGKTGGGYAVDTRLDAMISPHANRNLSFSTVPVADKEDVKRGYLGMLMTTWRIVPTSLRGPWETAIEDYLVDKGQMKGGTPATVVIDTGTTLKFNATGKQLVMPSIDYFQYYTAVGAKWDMHKTTDAMVTGSRGDTWNLLKKIVDRDVAESPGINRTSNRFDSNNIFSWSHAALTKSEYSYFTGRGALNWQHIGTTIAIMDVLTLGRHSNGGTLRGFVFSGFHFPLANPDSSIASANLGVKFTASPDLHPVPTTSEVLAKQVTLTFRHPNSLAITNKWQTVFKDDTAVNKTVNVKITPTRTASPTAKVAPAYTSSEGNFTTGVNMTQAQFLEFIQGKKTLTILDNTVNEPIAAGTTTTYTYKPKFEVTYILNGVSTKAFIDLTDTASFKRQKPPPDPIIFTSEPSAFAELKEGTPDNESFEAMAGVPSNKRLYLGVGGSEYIVDVELEYKQNVDSVWRKYRSYFSATDSEHKAGDTAGTYSVGGNSVNAHTGGTTTKTWSGSVPWTGSHSASSWHGGSVTNTWDHSAAIAAKAEADAWAATVNATVISHTSVSEPQTRTFNGWGAATTGSASDGPAGTWTNGVTPVPAVPASGTPGQPGYNPGKPAVIGVPAKSTAGSAGSYSYTVTGTIPAHKICGPECTYVLPMVEDKWQQKINFDYMKISRVEVYKIEEGRITAVDNLFGDGNSTLQATIKSTDPTTFVNIAQKNANGNDVEAQSSKHGRLRYSLDGNQHDVVEYNEGVRTNKSAGQGTNGTASAIGQTHARAQGILYTNSTYSTAKDYHKTTANATDELRPEFIKFNQRRTALNKATVISDMLVLQTSSGDQAVMYFDKESATVQAQEQFPDVNATKVEMWDNNPNSASKWKAKQVNVGSYNGQYTQSGGSNRKYGGYNQVTSSLLSGSPYLSTAFDGNGVGVNAGQPRPSRPGKLYIYDSRAIVPTTPNGSYQTGDAEVFYKRVLDWKSPNPYVEFGGAALQDNMYDAQVQANFGSKTGLVLQAPYSENHSKVNDVVIHTPVSVQDATLISLPSDRDQRTATPAGGADSLIQEQNALKVCPLDPALCEFRVLNCKHRLDTVLAEIDFENSTPSTILNKTTGAYIPYTTSTGITMANKAGFGSGKSLNAFGDRWSLDFQDIGLTNDKLTTVLVEMDFWMPSPASGNTMIASFEGYDFYIPTGGVGTWNTGNGWEKRLDGVNFKDNKMRLGLQFSLGHIEDSKLFINGVEQTTYTRVGDSSDVTGKIGTKLNIGSWGLSGDYDAQFYVDNLKITRKGGTLSHTESCYITTVTHETKMTHVHDPSCYEAATPVAQTFNYTGGAQTFTAPHTGTYTLETWGAEGGTAPSYGTGGRGGYSKGSVTLTKGETVYIHVGQKGVNGGSGSNAAYNGGGAPQSNHQFIGGGGGATDIRLTSGAWNLSAGLNSRIIVAGGGGGGGAEWGAGNEYAGAGGGTNGQDSGWAGSNQGSSPGRGGTQTSGGGPILGTFGIGATSTTGQSGSGGGGWYGGGGQNTSPDSGGGGGSGYVLTSTSHKPAGYSVPSTYYMTSTQTIAGNASMPSVSGGTQVGQTGDGKAKITSSGGTGTTLVCNNLPLNLLTQNNKHVHDASCITEVDEKEELVPQSANFTYSGSMQTWTVPATGDYIIEAAGGVGGSATATSLTSGKGAIMKGTYTLTQGTVLQILVGGKGQDSNQAGGGGGGSYVYTGSTPYIVAGGGGGAGSSGGNGRDASITNSAVSGYNNGASTVGYGGNSSSNSGWGGAGAGWLGNGGTGGTYGGGGNSYANGGAGGFGWNYPNSGAGGFGGGGGGGNNGAGGGGGYTGGPDAGGGAGSYNNGTNQLNSISNISNGYVNITSVNGGSSVSEGSPLNFNYSGTIQTWTVPETGKYKIDALGAEGGKALATYLGGKGAKMTGTFDLVAGQQLKILVGQKGFDSNSGNRGGGGGGGSFVTHLNNSPVIIAGGGGGAGDYENGQGGLTTPNGGAGTVETASGGASGNGGSGATWASGGAGLLTDGSTNTSSQGGSVVPKAFVNGGAGGVKPTSWADTAHGGFGGGGWAYAGAGGGGGYSGGGAGGWSLAGRGGGGGSYNIGSSPNNLANINSGNGQVVITPLELEEENEGFGDYEWAEIFGPNWATYVKETTTTTTVGGGTPQTFAYSTSTRTFNVPTTGDYTLEVWGAAGGASRNAVGGNGGYAKGNISLNQGDTLTILTGGKGGGSSSSGYWSSRASGGFNGGGSSGSDIDSNDNGSNETGGGGGGYTIIKRGTTTLLAGGGGGGGNYSSSGGTGSAGGGGGGSYGSAGNSGSGMNETGNVKIGGDGGGLSGTGYTNTLISPSVSAGVNNTDGYARITSLPKTVSSTTTTVDWAKVKADVPLGNFPQKMADGKPNPIFAEDALTYNVHVHTAACVTTKTLACSEPHHSGSHYDGSNPICWDACGDDHNHKQLKPEVTKPDGTLLQSGTFVNMDYPFTVYFPNRGDFAQQPSLQGLGSVTTSRGLGYVDSMDTTQYTQEKRVKFDFNVSYNNQIYTSGSWISLPVNQEMFEFQVPLANSEAVGTSVQFDVVAINGSPTGTPENDNFSNVTNRERSYDFSAYHGAFKETYIDLIGRIGNFVVSDTEDFRFSNLFKQEAVPEKWLVEGLVKEVDSNRQSRYYGDLVDLRGMPTNSVANRLDTYGTQTWLRQQPLPFPVNPKDNQNPALKEQFLKVGYDIFGDIQTTGNYQDGVVRVLPYYYKLDLGTGSITPLDVHVKSGEVYNPVNIYRGADAGTLPANLSPYDLILDWEKEAPRRNYTMDEAITTDKMANLHGEYITGPVNLGNGVIEEGVTGIKRLTTPLGNFVNIGNSQRIVADKKARTFIGSSQTNGVEQNFGNAIPSEEWEYAAQRWHLKLGLPSSSVFVEAGQPVNKANIDAVQSGDAVILMSADIISIGEIYSLRWTQPGISSFTVTKNGKTRPFNIAGSGLPPVIALYDLSNTAVIDVTVKGSH